MSYKLFWVGFILVKNLLTTKDTKEHEGFKEKERENSSSLAIFALSLALPWRAGVAVRF